jgi:hypothetical protein
METKNELVSSRMMFTRSFKFRSFQNYGNKRPIKLISEKYAMPKIWLAYCNIEHNYRKIKFSHCVAIIRYNTKRGCCADSVLSFIITGTSHIRISSCPWPHHTLHDTKFHTPDIRSSHPLHIFHWSVLPAADSTGRFLITVFESDLDSGHPLESDMTSQEQVSQLFYSPVLVSLLAFFLQNLSPKSTLFLNLHFSLVWWLRCFSFSLCFRLILFSPAPEK